MDITDTLYITNRADWRQWLTDNHATAREIWLIYYSKQSGKARIPYLEAVEEALCFGWIDGIEKKIDSERSAQRFTPRRPKSNWTELNKERARRLIANGQMTKAGLAKVPDLSIDAFRIPDDIRAALEADPQAWANFQQFSPLYQRIRIGFIDEVRKQSTVFQKRLAYFIKMTAENKQYGVME